MKCTQQRMFKKYIMSNNMRVQTMLVDTLIFFTNTEIPENIVCTKLYCENIQ